MEAYKMELNTQALCKHCNVVISLILACCIQAIFILKCLMILIDDSDPKQRKKKQAVHMLATSLGGRTNFSHISL